MSESKTPSELTEPGDRTEAMMYWHERAMKAEAERDAAIQAHSLCLAVSSVQLAERDALAARVAELERSLKVAQALEKDATECNQFGEWQKDKADARRYRWLQEHTVTTGLSTWIYQMQATLLSNAVDAALSREEKSENMWDTIGAPHNEEKS